MTNMIHKTFLISLAATASVLAAEPTKVEITCNDQMAFSTKAVEVPAGAPVSLTLKNIGKLPVEAMGHNLVILKPGSAVTDYAMKSMAAKDKGYISQDPEAMKLVVASTKLLGPDQSDTITFTPTEAGDYPFLCSFPGHFGVMQGVMTVKAK